MDFGTAAVGNQCIDQACEIVNSLVEEYPDNREYLMGSVKYELRRWDQFLKGTPIKSPADVADKVFVGMSRAVERCERLRELMPHDQDIVALQFSLSVAGQLVWTKKNDDLSERHFEQAISMIDDLQFDDIIDIQIRQWTVSYADLLLLELLLIRADTDRAEPILTKLIDFVESRPSSFMNDQDRSVLLASLIEKRIILFRKKDPNFDALSDFILLYDLRLKGLEFEPNDHSLRFDVAKTAYSIGVRLSERNRSDEAETWAEKAATMFKEILDYDASHIHAMSMLLMTEQLRGDIFLRLSRYQDAIASFEFANTIESYHQNNHASPNLGKILLARAFLGQYDIVREQAPELSKKLDPVFSLQLALAASVCAAGVDNEEERKLFQRMAIDLLNHMLSISYSGKNLDLILRDLQLNPLFDTLREIDAFQQILQRANATNPATSATKN
jgi:tetratricopeptide (TPR) repeat protein